jgi:hypothetical protein
MKKGRAHLHGRNTEMNPITVQSTENVVQITFDKTLVPMDFLLDLLEKLQIEYLAKKINFSENVIQVGEEIKQEWWQQHKQEFLKGTAYAKSRA